MLTMSLSRFCKIYYKQLIVIFFLLYLCGIYFSQSIILTMRPMGPSILQGMAYYDYDGQQHQQQQQTRNVTSMLPDDGEGIVWKKGANHRRAGSYRYSSEAEPKRCGSGGSTVTKKTTRDFVRVTNEIIVFSAYMDTRQPQAYVRIMAVLEQTSRNRAQTMHCLFPMNSTTSYPSRLRLYEMCENHNKPYGGYILSCTVPPQLSAATANNGRGEPRHVHHRQDQPSISAISAQNAANLTQKAEVSSLIAVESSSSSQVQPCAPQYKFGTCVPPIFGSVAPAKIVEFIELTRILGSEHFFFYVYRDPLQVRLNRPQLTHHHVLQYYANRGLTTIVPWDLPVPKPKIWYYGQSIAIGDCLYRNMGRFARLTFNDIDEYIVPQPPYRTSQELVDSSAWNQNVSGYRVHSTFFPPDGDHPAQMSSMEYLVRTKTLSHVRTKIMVQPERIFELGIHHISRPMHGFISELLPSDAAILHHYRRCLANFGMDCKSYTNDTNMLR